jgi:hypothetical protein
MFPACPGLYQISLEDLGEQTYHVDREIFSDFPALILERWMRRKRHDYLIMQTGLLLQHNG